MMNKNIDDDLKKNNISIIEDKNNIKENGGINDIDEKNVNSNNFSQSDSHNNNLKQKILENSKENNSDKIFITKSKNYLIKNNYIQTSKSKKKKNQHKFSKETANKALNTK